MSLARRIAAIIFTVITVLGVLWVAIGWVSMWVNGRSWSDALAMATFSAILALLSLVCAFLWGSRMRALSIGLLVLFALSVVSCFASMS